MSAAPDVLSRNRPLADRFRALGETGLFASLADLQTLEVGCRRLSRLAYEAQDLGVFISVIAAAGLAAPILQHHAPPTASMLGRLLADALAGRAILAVAITEGEAGSDVLSMRTIGELLDDRDVLVGAVTRGSHHCKSALPRVRSLAPPKTTSGCW